jgi:hypothetical protein
VEQHAKVLIGNRWQQRLPNWRDAVGIVLVLALLALIVTSAQQMVTPWAIVQQSAVSLSPELFSYDDRARHFKHPISTK